MSFRFKQFYVEDSNCAMKVGTDGVLLGCFIGQELSTITYQLSTLNCLDIGTGSGLISLMVAQQLPDAQILSIDIDHDATLQAQANFAASPWAERLNAKHCSLQEYVKFHSSTVQNPNTVNHSIPLDFGTAQAIEHLSTGTFQLIFSNPPFFQNSLKNPDAQRSLARHTDTLSIDYLYLTASQLLADDGHFFVILPYEAMLPVFPNGQLASRILVRGHEHKPYKRQLLHYIKTSQVIEPTERTLTLQDQNNQRTVDYQAFAQYFYL